MKLCPYCHNPLSDADVDQLQSENKMLRELANIGEYAAKECASLAEQNAKLRELCGEVAGILFNLEVDRCGLCDRDSINHPCPVHTAKGGECLIKSELHELGVVL